jgi:hypothetical protein
VICYFQNAGKFKVRYQTLGFSDKAKIDDGAMWPIQYALSKLTATEEAKITALVKKAVRCGHRGRSPLRPPWLNLHLRIDGRVPLVFTALECIRR